MIEYTYEQPGPVELEPEELLKSLKSYATEHGREYMGPQDSSWLIRRLNTFQENLKQAGVSLETDVKRNGRRLVRLRGTTMNSLSRDKVVTDLMVLEELVMFPI